MSETKIIHRARLEISPSEKTPNGKNDCSGWWFHIIGDGYNITPDKPFNSIGQAEGFAIRIANKFNILLTSTVILPDDSENAKRT